MNLYLLFQSYGTVIDININKRSNFRGQAFITYEKDEQAKMALKSLQNFQFFDKKLDIQNAKNKSYVSLVKEGKFIYKDYKNKISKIKKPEQSTSKKTLLIENMPPDTTDEYFEYLLKQFPGLENSRLLNDKTMGVAEFKTEKQANVVLKTINGFKWGSHFILKVSYMNQTSE